MNLQEPASRPVWLRVDRLLGEWGIPTDSPAGRQGFSGRVEGRRRAEGPGEYEPAGWCLGSEEFRQELLEQVSHQARLGHVREEVHQSAQVKAERIIREELEALGWSAADLGRHRKGDTAKVRMAPRLGRETTMTLHWLAERLHLGSAGHVSHLFYRKGANASEVSGEGCQFKLF